MGKVDSQRLISCSGIERFGRFLHPMAFKTRRFLSVSGKELFPHNEATSINDMLSILFNYLLPSFWLFQPFPRISDQTRHIRLDIFFFREGFRHSGSCITIKTNGNPMAQDQSYMVDAAYSLATRRLWSLLLYCFIQFYQLSAVEVRIDILVLWKHSQIYHTSILPPNL